MKALVFTRKLIVSTVFLMLTAVPVISADFELGTRFGGSFFIPDNGGSPSTVIAYTRLPAGAFIDVSTTPTSLYATGFLGKYAALGAEFSLGTLSVSDESWDDAESGSITTFHFGGRASYFLLSHWVSSPYVFGRISHNIFSGDWDLFFDDDDDLSLISIGSGFGYQWRIGSAFVLRTEVQYQRVFVVDADDGANEFSFNIGIGTRFGNSETSK